MAGRKSMLVAYLLCLFAGPFGAHRFYLRRYGSAVFHLLTLGVFGLWTFVDLFLIPRMVREENGPVRDASFDTSVRQAKQVFPGDPS